MKILHITESLAGGVVNSISQIANAQSSDGVEVIVAHSIRASTPDEETLNKKFPKPIQRIIVPMVTPISPMRDIKSLIKLYLLIKSIKPDVIHLHSSKAGALGRISSRLNNLHHVTYYSPRGLSFLREDVSWFKRKIFIFYEKVANRFGGSLIACSLSEGKIAKKVLGIKDVFLIENSVDVVAIPSKSDHESMGLVIATSGRICYQKAPWRFKILAEKFAKHNVQFLWIGDGELLPELMTKGVLMSNIRVTGWLDRDLVVDELMRCDIFVLTSMWEGMPLALIEAQVAGIPAVVTNVVGNRDVVLDGQTGFVCDDDDDLVNRLGLLIEDQKVRKEMGLKARHKSLERFSIERMHGNLMTLYTNPLGRADYRI